jgi:Cu/Ag efflux protein CusF
MKKTLGLAVALTLALSLSAAAAEQTSGTVQAVDPTDQSIILDDGTRISVSGGQMTAISVGDKVLASYEMKGDKKVAVELTRVRPDDVQVD